MKCGLEIHQRLDTKKLFCECYADPNKQISEKAHCVTRRLIALSGETGTTDQTALFEAASEKTFEYACGEKTSCLVEIDEEPPHLINEQALSIGLQLAKALKSKIVSELHVMRKTIIDGSAVSGFQRTALIGINGEVKVGGKKIGIESICLEEESARIIDRTNGKRVSYGLDRQGIPLIEIATAPDIETPQMAKQVALEIGEILRNTGLVQRGLGTIRQDLNVSIEGGERIEIKGCQDLDAIEKIIQNEANRQKALLEIREQLQHRKARPNGKSVDVTPVFKNTENKIISNGIAGGAKVFGVKLAGFKNLLSKEIMPGFSFGKELEDRAKQMGARGILHNDEDLEKCGISVQERKTVEELLNLSGEDAFMLCVDGEATARKSLQNAVNRANYAVIGIPKETRRAEGLLTRFMRPLGGSARMYPETD
ncbi:Glu-tRNA(Gln) amidotransferase subunit GatE, partial [Candidatus Micrarchaeota archaeon]|nr:Glu-tRNA(Gln) amidotransferase subunit GatE [Candidatus Micrarchaeota archaeon]